MRKLLHFGVLSGEANALSIITAATYNNASDVVYMIVGTRPLLLARLVDDCLENELFMAKDDCFVFDVCLGLLLR